MAVSISPMILLVVVAGCCWSFASSGILPGPVRGYETYRHTSQSYDSRTGAFQSYTLTSRQCSVIRRMTQYETVRVPFLCQAVTGRVVPLPSHMGSSSAQVISAMQAGGWSVCSQRVTVPLYRYQRIPVCCPGTTPTPEGGCLCRKAGSPVVPSPGQLLQSSANIFTDLPESARQGYSPTHRPTPSTLVVQPPRPYRGMLSKLPAGSVSSTSLLHQVSMGGPSYRVVSGERTSNPSPYLPGHPMSGAGVSHRDWDSDIARYLAAMMYQTLLVEQQQKHLEDEITRQLRLRQQMEFFYRLQQQKRQQPTNPWGHKQGPAISVSFIPRPQPHPIPSPPIQLEDPTVVSHQAYPSTPAPKDDGYSQGVPDASQPGAVGEGALEEGEGALEEGENVPQWNGESGGILHDKDMDQQQQQQHGQQGQQDNGDGAGSPIPDPSTPMFGNGPRNIPPGAGGIMETKEKAKGIIDGCLKDSGLPAMEAVLASGDINQLRPICSSTQTVGPCVLREAEQTFGQDQLGLIGRGMMRSLLMSLGQLCSRVDQMATTSPPVFPNPPPPVTESVVTRVSGHIFNGGDTPATQGTPSSDIGRPSTEDVLVAQEAAPELQASPQDVPQVTPQPSSTPRDKFEHIDNTAASEPNLDVPAATPSPVDASHQGGVSEAHAHAHVATEKMSTAPGDHTASTHTAFPMWLILAMVGGCALLLLFTCLTVCLVLRCRRKKKSLELEREPEKLPVPPTGPAVTPAQGNIYAASPCHQPPPSYTTTAVNQTLGGEGEGLDGDFKIPEDTTTAPVVEGGEGGLDDDDAKEAMEAPAQPEEKKEKAAKGEEEA